MINIQARELYLGDFEKNLSVSCVWTVMDQFLSNITKLHILIPAQITLTFTQGYRIMRNLVFVHSSLL